MSLELTNSVAPELTTVEPVQSGQSLETDKVAPEEEGSLLRRSQRTHVPTEKVRQNTQDELSKSFWRKYRECESFLHNIETDSQNPSCSTMQDSLNKNLDKEMSEINQLYSRLRETYHTHPPSEVRRAVDIISTRMQGIRQRSQDVASVNSSCSKRSSASRSLRSSRSSQLRLEEEVNMAALQAEFAAQTEENERKEELSQLELEETKRRAEAQMELEKKKRAIERQQVSTKLKVQQARLKVLQDQDRNELSEKESSRNIFRPGIEMSWDKPQCVTEHQAVAAINNPLDVHQPSASGESTAFHDVTEPKYVVPATKMNPANTLMSHTLNPLASEWQPLMPSARNDIQLLADAVLASVSLNRLPVPEPPIFTGDALSYPDWKASFSALIESKGIPPHERIHYLRRYVGGAAREMVSGYFLLTGEHAYDKAKKALEERYGDPFVISEAFRDKLESWPKISPKDNTGLRRFADFLAQCEVAMAEIKSLNVLNDCRENRKLLQKLPDWLVNRWSRVVCKMKDTYSYPSFTEFVKFVTNEASIACDPVTSLSSLKQTQERSDVVSQKGRALDRSKILATETKSKNQCAFCNRENHSFQDCRVFAKKPLAERHQYVKVNGFCYRCLERGHQAKSCTKRSTCKRCQGKHPTSLHEERQKLDQLRHVDGNLDDVKRANPSEMTAPNENSDQEIRKARCDGVSNDNKENMSSMVVPVWISSTEHPERELLVYALLDTQSDTTFVLRQTGESLETQREPVQLRLTTMTAKDKVVQCDKFKHLTIRGFNSDIRIKLPVTYSREYIPFDESHIPTPETARKWPHLREVADSLQPLLNCEVGLLIGYDCCQALAPRHCITGEGNQPFAVETDLGWSIVGRNECREDSGDAIGLSHRVITKPIPECVQLPNSHQEVKYACNTKMKEEAMKPSDIVQILESDFSEVQDQDAAMSQEDISFLKILREGIYKEDKHYVMPLPFKGTRPLFPNNKLMARHRLDNLKRRFLKDHKHYTEYNKFVAEVLQQGDAERICEEATVDGQLWYIPHHGIYHPKKPNKIRVVFDCSAKYKGISLNDHLLQGPDQINSLIGVLCRFRQEPIALMCDIERMFHQFLVCPSDRDYLRFLWWDKGDLSSEPTEYRMKVHLFGAVSSPGCANYGLKCVARDNPQFGSEAVKFITKNFYVDDGLTSVNTAANAISLVDSARKMCAEGGLRLHKFVSNNKSVIESIPLSERAENIKSLDLTLENLPVERVLGIQWCIESDEFQFRLIVKDQPLTRRGILSTVSSVFDPLGFVSPFILRAKQILQEICHGGIGWDDPIPESLRIMWEKWRQDLPQLASLKIRRCFQPGNFEAVKRVELHHFSDASLKGYGECSYVKLIDAMDRVHCSLAMAKARVTPLKPTTVPRLELQAAVTSAQISAVLARELEYQVAEHYFWTDSKVVLGYIKNDARRFHTFVSNRVQRIRNISSPEQWRYVDTTENPADHASRGLGAVELFKSNWFTGPTFLWERNNAMTERADQFSLSSDDPEVKKVQVLLTNSSENSTVISRLDRFSQWSKAIKAMAVLIRYLHRKKGRNTDDLAVQVRTEQITVSMLQRQAFSEDIDALSKLRPAKTKGLQKLDPFVDDQGMLRVGGRLKQSSLPFSIKHPLILPRRSHVGNLIILHCHEQVAHQGRGMTTNKLRENGYWIMGCSSAVSSVVYKCVKCRRLRGKSQEQKMASLPEERLESSPPFTYCGMDCFGPFYIKERRTEQKRYGLLFTCLALRAVHIEVIDDMSTDAFLNGLRCFIAIRGPARMIRCDQGSNFIGAKHELWTAMKEVDSERVKAALLQHHCEFKLNPPCASHMGGIWERQIRTIRSVLSGLLDHSSSQLDSSSLRTLMYEVMAIINSRPLTADNVYDANAPVPLTPNHLLTMKTSVIMPPPGEFVKEDLYLKRRWRRVQYLANQFWSRWKREYLCNLQVRQKWRLQKLNVKVGDIVILKDDDKHRSDWRLARVHETIRDDDGLVRKVKVVVGDTQLDDKGRRISKPLTLERPIQKLIILLEIPPET